MAPERIDPEVLAAFLDGGLNGDDAARVREQLAKSDESYQLMLESSALLRELERTETVAGEPLAAAATPIRPRRSHRTVWTIGSVLLAAGIGAVLITRPGRETVSPLPGEAAMAVATPLDTSIVRLGSNWNEPGWSTVRGASSSPSSEAAAFRLGARFVELEAALNARDTAAVATARATLVALVSSLDGGPLVAPSITGFTRASLTFDVTRRQTINQLRSLGPDPVWFDLGAWCESARLTVGTSNDVLTQPASTRQSLDAIVRSSERLPNPSRRAIEEILDPLRALLKSDPLDRATASRLIDSAVVAGGSVIPR